MLTAGEQLLADQRARFAALDALLPVPGAPPDCEVLVATTAAGLRVAGTVVWTSWPPGTLPRLWSAAEVTELHPILGAAGGGMAALLAAWREWLAGAPAPGADSAGLVCWPSRDVEATRALLDHGLVPLSVIAVRTGPASPEPADAAVSGVRPATPADLDGCLRLALAELAYSALVGNSVVRPEAAALKRTALADRLQRGEPVWVAAQHGELVGMVECGSSEVTPGSVTAGRLRPGRWGYVNCASVSPAARGRGIGRSLLAAAHRELSGPEVAGSYLYFNPANPLSSVFWPRQGYRPLWTIWEVRPVTALR